MHMQLQHIREALRSAKRLPIREVDLAAIEIYLRVYRAGLLFSNVGNLV